MDTITLPFITYVIVTTFTPGPNNVAAAAAGIKIGYRKSLSFLLGIVAGFCLVMLLSGYFNYALHSRYATIAFYIKWIGFFYMLWLCLSLFLHPAKDGKAEAGKVETGTYTPIAGLLLQLVNPKVILYGITLYGMFSSALLSTFWTVLASAAALSVVGFISVTTWCLAGSALTLWLGNRRNQLFF
ncbi:MAG: LysE family transporter, partial [Spirochaetota bacterium]